jgi:hypothetical protein
MSIFVAEFVRIPRPIGSRNSHEFRYENAERDIKVRERVAFSP